METTQQQAVKALLALSHSTIEHTLYEALFAATREAESSAGAVFSLRLLLNLTGLNSYSTLRRARKGLITKLSIECSHSPEERGGQAGSLYLVYTPEEVFERRRRSGLEPYPKEYQPSADGHGFVRALGRVVGARSLSRREAQVALCCTEGLTNAEIGERLFITEQTVKFHLRHIFVKFGVRRRGELISRLLQQDDLRAERAVW